MLSNSRRRRWLIAAALGLVFALLLLFGAATLHGHNPGLLRLFLLLAAPGLFIPYNPMAVLGLKSLAHPRVVFTLVNFLFYSLVFYLLLSAFAALTRVLRKR